MSYYKIKNFSINEKDNKIMVTAADSSLRPLSFFRSEYHEKAATLREKLRCFVRSLSGRCLHPVRSLYRLNYAYNRAQEVCGCVYDADDATVEKYLDIFLTAYKEKEKPGEYMVIRDGRAIRACGDFRCWMAWPGDAKYSKKYRFGYFQAHNLSREFGGDVVEVCKV